MKTKKKIPSPIRLGETIALVNPAGMLPCRFRKQYDYVREYLTTLGFGVRDFVIDEGWEDSQKRCDALLGAFTDPEVKAIMSICGGTRIHDILPALDYHTIASHPKIICGSSELSALMIAIAEQAGMVTFFGPHLNFLNPKASKQENRYTVASYWNMLRWDWHGRSRLSRNEAYHLFAAPRDQTGNFEIRNIYLQPDRIADERWRDNFYCTLNPDQSSSGELVIGSLASMLRLCEIGLAPDVADKIVILDSLDITLKAVVELVERLNEYCCLDRASALVFSSLSERTDRESMLLPELRDRVMICEFLRDVSRLIGDNMPIYHGFPLGHCAYKLTVPMGVVATIDSQTGSLIIKDSPYLTENAQKG